MLASEIGRSSLAVQNGNRTKRIYITMEGRNIFDIEIVIGRPSEHPEVTASCIVEYVETLEALLHAIPPRNDFNYEASLIYSGAPYAGSLRFPFSYRVKPLNIPYDSAVNTAALLLTALGFVLGQIVHQTPTPPGADSIAVENCEIALQNSFVFDSVQKLIRVSKKYGFDHVEIICAGNSTTIVGQPTTNKATSIGIRANEKAVIPETMNNAYIEIMSDVGPDIEYKGKHYRTVMAVLTPIANQSGRVYQTLLLWNSSEEIPARGQAVAVKASRFPSLTSSLKADSVPESYEAAEAIAIIDGVQTFR
jgi:hypothetical protein